MTDRLKLAATRTEAEPVAEDLIESWVQRLATDIPDAVAVFLKGSFARGDAAPFSDIDFDVIVGAGRAAEFPWWLDRLDDRLVHISVTIRGADDWLGAEAEPASWALGFAAAEATRLMWVRDPDWRRRLDRTALTHPAADPELEDFVAEFAKMANARSIGDAVGLRAAAARLAGYGPGVLRPLNESDDAPIVVASARDALSVALRLAVVPNGYVEDMLTCLGQRATGDGELFDAAHRLVAGTVELVGGDQDLARYVQQIQRG